MSVALLVVIRDPISKNLTSQTIYFTHAAEADAAKASIQRAYQGNNLSVGVTILHGAEA